MLAIFVRPQEIPENGADVAHLPQVHGPIMTTGIDLRYTYSKLWNFAKHQWIGSWAAGTGDQKHVGTMSLTHSIMLWGFRLPVLDLTVQAKQVGTYNRGNGHYSNTLLLIPVEKKN